MKIPNGDSFFSKYSKWAIVIYILSILNWTECYVLEQIIVFLDRQKNRLQAVGQKAIVDLIIVFWESYLQYTSTLIDFIAGDPKPFSALQ